jgi:hypothetical protein
VNFRIDSVDHAPEDLDAQIPLRGRLLRTIEGPPRRPVYWIAQLEAALTWEHDGVSRTVSNLILTPRWEGTSIAPGAKLPVNIWYVLDNSVLGSRSFEARQAAYVAIGMARVRGPSWWARLWTRVFGVA